MNLDHMKRAADEAALATHRDFVLVRINGGDNVRLLDLAEFFNLPEVLEVELLHSTLAARVRSVIGPDPSYTAHDAVYAHATRQEHQASRRVGPLDRRAREQGKIAKFFRDLFFVSSHHMLLVAVLILAGLATTGCSNPTEPAPRIMCVDSWVDGALVPGPCTEIQP